MKTTLGIIGLGVMGKSLARNFASKGFHLSLYNRHLSGKEEHVALEFIQEFPELNDCIGFDDIESFIESLESPRKILIMVNAGNPVDMVIGSILDLLEADDILIDGGNSYYKDTSTRKKLLNDKGVHFIGLGISGGEEGALNGPSLMPGGNKTAYAKVEEYLLAIAAKDPLKSPCCRYIGDDGAGHFVKMVHNGIEYAEMQIIAEVYSLLRFSNDLSPVEIASIFESWNDGDLRNYLLEITIDILRKKDGEYFLIDLILDQASHKGTGSWTTIAAAELGVPFTMSSAALNARFISSMKDQRVGLSKIYKMNQTETDKIDVDKLKNAYHLSRLVNHHQGFQLIDNASEQYSWDIDLQHVSQVWTNGCIIASQLMQDLVGILSSTRSILESERISKILMEGHSDYKETIASAIKYNMATPCLSEGLNFLNAITQAQGTGNIIQAQRDYFGAHTYKRKDDPYGPSHHTNWKT